MAPQNKHEPIKGGRPVAPINSRKPLQEPRRPGVAQGLFVAPESIDSANPLVAELFEEG
jgi:hypothetical protein